MRKGIVINMENLNVVNDTQQAVVEPAQVSTDTGAVGTGTPEAAEKAETTVRRQSAAENSGFKKLRIENESYKKEIAELKQKLSGLSELESVKAQNDKYLDIIIKDKMARDLELIQKADPGVTDLASLGEQFIKLVECGVDASVAYNAVKKAKDGNLQPKPPGLGAIGRSEHPRSQYYTSKELDRLTAKDLEDPAVYKKAMESLKRL